MHVLPHARPPRQTRQHVRDGGKLDSEERALGPTSTSNTVDVVVERRSTDFIASPTSTIVPGVVAGSGTSLSVMGSSSGSNSGSGALAGSPRQLRIHAIAREAVSTRIARRPMLPS